MKRRILLAATVVAGASLGLLGTGIVAASGKSRATVHYHSVALSCPLPASGSKPTSGLFLTVVPPAGSTAVIVPADHGYMFGNIRCPSNSLSGLVRVQFSTNASNSNQTGTIQEYFGAGSIDGTFTLVPEGPPAGGGFGSETWAGVAKFEAGTGIYSGVTSRKPYSFACSTLDGVHVQCSEAVTLRVKDR